jgi:hypothetical protein
MVFCKDFVPEGEIVEVDIFLILLKDVTGPGGKID